MKGTINKQRFVLIAELEEDGYVLGYYDSLELAKRKHEEYWDLISYTNESLNEVCRFHVEEMLLMKDSLYGQTNGFLSLYIKVGVT